MKFMLQGSLDKHLHCSEYNRRLGLKRRLRILKDVAHGMEYLHHHCSLTIVHCDLKPSNILLNEHMQAKIADFGLSRAFATENDSHVSTRPAGTLGYLDPE